jgi:hypothetical protein
MADEAGSKLTFFSKQPLTCPVCGREFHREDLRTGGGRLIAGDLTEELRRLYEPSKKYGPVYPLIYAVLVCPTCFFATYPKDFTEVPEEITGDLEAETEKRVGAIKEVFTHLEFEEPRGLKEGVAGYFFAVMSYDFFPKEFSPTIKQGLSSLRAAWLSNDLHKAYPQDNYDYLSKIFYRKARFFYTLAVEYEQSGKENMAAAGHLGPDLDKNYGYDGVLYLAAYLEYVYGPKEDPEQRKKALQNAKRTVARIFGMGRASKNKPAAILDKAKELHSKIGSEIEQLG